MYNYTIKYRTFDQLLSEVSMDFQNIDLENFIEPHQLIKVAKRVNYDLGLRIMMTKEALLDVEKGRVKLPDDFFVLNYAMICDEGSMVLGPYPQGTHIEERKIVPAYQETPAVINPCTDGPVNCQVCQSTVCGCGTCNSCQPTPCSCTTPPVPAACSTTPYNPLVPYGDSCIKPRVFMNCKGDCYELVQVVNSGLTQTYRRLLPLRILENPQDVECGCPNLYMNTSNQAWIQNGYLFTSFKTGKVYINYQGMMEDDEGNLLVPDHDMLNEYYEYAMKQRILENLIMNDENVDKKLQLVESRLRGARNNALSIVNTPNFAEMKRVWAANRKAQYARYYEMFKSYPWYQWDKNPNNFMGERLIR
jgi:hypothetical protein